MFNILAAVLGIGAVIAYLKGVRGEEAWGAPALVVLALGAVVMVIIPLTGVTEGWEEQRMRSARYDHYGQLGEHLSGEMNSGSIIVLDPQAYARGELREEALESLGAGAGFDINVVEYADSISDVQSAADQHPDAEAVIHFGLNPLTQRAISELGELPMPFVTVLVGIIGPDYSRSDLEEMRGYIEEGVISALLFESTDPEPEIEGQKVLIHSGNLDELDQELARL